MEQAYLKNREKSSKISKIVGIGLAVLVHLCALLILGFKGLSYIYPPPEESSFLIDFTEQEEFKPDFSKEPVAEEVDMEKPVELVQKSESPIEEESPNETPQTEADKFGDVAMPEPEQEKPKLDPRAAFPGTPKKPSDAGTAHSSKKTEETFRAGQPEGNSDNTLISGRSNAHLQGRNVVGGLAEPNYNKQESGIVVVSIWVDVYGNVRNAIAGAPGTTIDDKTLWSEARNAAMKTHFTRLNNITESTPELQEGKITYIFKLK
ncbi:MAG: hypothetical protein ACI3ZF_04975 [Candidatus Cryptobacteroides sp.]